MTSSSHLLERTPRATAVTMSSMESPEREKSVPQPEEPVNSIEDDGAVSEDQWQGMGDMLMAIYDFREPE